MKRSISLLIASAAIVAAPIPAHATEASSSPLPPPVEQPASDSVPDPWTMLVDQFARDHGITYVRADDKIGAWLRCMGVPRCQPGVEQWRRIAGLAGWPESDWPTLACLIWIESRGDETVVYRGTRRRPEWSLGLTQLNTRGSLLARFGGLTRDDLLDPETNLREARRIFESEGLRPWGSRCRSV